MREWQSQTRVKWYLPRGDRTEVSEKINVLGVSVGGQALQSKQFCLLSVNKEVWLGRASPG